MTTNLAGGVCLAELQACVFRAARLDWDCTFNGGEDAMIVTAGMVQMTAEPEIEEGQRFEPENGCGVTMFVKAEDDRLLWYDLEGEFVFHDYEMMSLLFGGDLILGKAGGPFDGEVIGIAERIYNAPPRSGVYLEVIVETGVEGLGDCGTGEIAPVAVGHIFAKARLNPGTIDFGNDVTAVSFTGTSVNNPSFQGETPFGQLPALAMFDTAHHEVGYTQAEYDEILTQVAFGFWEPTCLFRDIDGGHADSLFNCDIDGGDAFTGGQPDEVDAGVA